MNKIEQIDKDLSAFYVEGISKCFGCGDEYIFNNINSAIEQCAYDNVNGINYIYFIEINNETKLGFSSQVVSRLKRHRDIIYKIGLNVGRVALLNIPFGIEFEESLHSALYNVLKNLNMSQSSIYDTETYPLSIESLMVLTLVGVDGYRNRYTNDFVDNIKNVPLTYAEIKDRLQRVKWKKDKLIDKYVDGLIDKETFRHKLLILEDNIKFYESKISNCGRRLSATTSTAAKSIEKVYGLILKATARD